MRGSDVRVLGVDGGGSQTTAVVVDAKGRILGTGRASGSNHQLIGMAKAAQNLYEAIEQATSRASLGLSSLAFVYYALAGADRPRDYAILRPGLASLPYRPCEVTGDAWAGLRAGTQDYVGVSLVCGSGSNAVGRDAAGKMVQVGGFGYPFGDGAGGSHLAQEAFRAAIRAWQGRGQETALGAAIAAHLGLGDIAQVYDDFLDHDREIPLSLAKVVHEVAHQGDPVAQKLLRDMGEELGVTALAVLRSLNFSKNDPIPVVLVGSIVQKGQSPYLLEPLGAVIHQAYPYARLNPLTMPPVFGAVLLAFDAIGYDTADIPWTVSEWEESKWH